MCLSDPENSDIESFFPAPLAKKWSPDGEYDWSVTEDNPIYPPQAPENYPLKIGLYNNSAARTDPTAQTSAENAAANGDTSAETQSFDRRFFATVVIAALAVITFAATVVVAVKRRRM